MLLGARYFWVRLHSLDIFVCHPLSVLLVLLQSGALYTILDNRSLFGLIKKTLLFGSFDEDIKAALSWRNCLLLLAFVAGLLLNKLLA